MIVGLTGQSGAGKTAVSEIFEENGFYIINADEISKEITAPDSQRLTEIKENFGEGVIGPDGKLDRRRLSAIVFADRNKKKLLEKIVHPYIMKEIRGRIQSLDEGALILLDAPLLLDSEAAELCEVTISVTADSKIRLGRIAERDGLSREQAILRFSAQRDEKFFIDNTDYNVENNGTLGELRKKAYEVCQKIKEGRGLR